MKILIFNPFGIGDVLFSTPLIRNLRRSFPEAGIWYICSLRVYPLLKAHPLLDRVVIFEKDQWRELLAESKAGFAREMLSFFRQIKKERFDLVFDLSLNSQYGFFFLLAGIKKRIGFDFKHRGRFLTHKKALPSGYCGRHVADHILELLAFAGIEPVRSPLEIFLDEEDKKKVRSRAEGLLGKKPVIAVCPGSGDSWQKTAYFKRWPEDNFVKLCDRLGKDLDARVVLFGSGSERPLAEYVRERAERKPLNLCGELSLPEFAGLLSFCDLLVTNDGGPFHIAQALGLKTVGIFGPVDEKVYGAYPEPGQALTVTAQTSCRPCYRSFRFPGCDRDKRCLRDISVDQVYGLVSALLADKKGL